MHMGLLRRRYRKKWIKLVRSLNLLDNAFELLGMTLYLLWVIKHSNGWMGFSKGVWRLADWFNSMTTGNFQWNFSHQTFKLISVIDGWGCEITLRLMSPELTDRMPTMVHVMCRQATSHYMMTSPNGNIFRVTGHLCGEFTGHRWIPLTKSSDAELWCFLDLPLNKRLSKQWRGCWFETSSRL